VHGLIATLLPAQLAPLSTLCIVLAEAAAIYACLRATRTAGDAMRTRWWLLAFSVLLNASAMTLDMGSEALGIQVTNAVPGLQVFFSALYGVPLLLAVSIQFDLRVFRAARIINLCLALATGAMFYVEVFSLVTIHGSDRPADALFLSRMFDALDLFLALAATIRAAAASQLQERRFFSVASIFLWANAILPSIHNHILLHHDFIWLDLLLSAPYLLLLVLTVLTPNWLIHRFRPSPELTRLVRSGSPIFLSLGLLLLSIVASRNHFYIGSAGVVLAIVCYGALNILTQSRDIEAEESLLAAKKTLEQLVSMDDLTHIPNRRAFDNTIERECRAAHRARQPLSLLMIDVDFFKQLNDTHGHLLGDDYLIQIARSLSDALPRSNDFVARYGGEEFAVILPITASSGAAEVAKKLHRAISGLALSHPSSPFGVITISIGWSTLDTSKVNEPLRLIDAADRALYKAKHGGRNRSEFLAIGDFDLR
jgi:diguanylate cyclase (GGDEF)-like protein